MGISRLYQYEMLLSSLFTVFHSMKIPDEVLIVPDFKRGLGARDWWFPQLIVLFPTLTTIVSPKAFRWKGREGERVERDSTKGSIAHNGLNSFWNQLAPGHPSHGEGWSENEAYQNAIDKLNYQTAYLRPTSAIWCPNFCRLLLLQQ